MSECLGAGQYTSPSLQPLCQLGGIRKENQGHTELGYEPSFGGLKPRPQGSWADTRPRGRRDATGRDLRERLSSPDALPGAGPAGGLVLSRPTSLGRGSTSFCTTCVSPRPYESSIHSTRKGGAPVLAPAPRHALWDPNG